MLCSCFDCFQLSGYYGPTNAEVLLWTDPRSEEYAMPYIYDTFQWTHCQEDFESLLEELSSAHTTKPVKALRV